MVRKRENRTQGEKKRASKEERKTVYPVTTCNFALTSFPDEIQRGQCLSGYGDVHSMVHNKDRHEHIHSGLYSWAPIIQRVYVCV